MQTWLFHADDGRLKSQGQSARLTAKARDVLMVLVRHKGEVVSHDKILSEVWRDINVTPDLVREYIFDIRSALGDDARHPRYIENVRGRGYRLIDGVALAHTGTDAHRQRPRIRVLRPDVFGAENRWHEIAAALGQEVVRDLATYPDLAVLARHSSIPAPTDGICGADELAPADYLVAISITVGKDRLVVSHSLIDGGDRTVISNHRLDAASGDLPKLTAEISTKITSTLGRFCGDIQRAAISKIRRKLPIDHNAYEEYLLAVECENNHTLEAWRRGLGHANRSIELDPTFARAWHMRGTFLRGLVDFFCDPDLDRKIALSEAIEARRHSIRLDPNDPHLLAWSADLDVAESNVAAARNKLARAADLGANQPDTLAFCALSFATCLGAFAEGERMINEALALAPLPPDWFLFVKCRVAFFVGDYSASVEAARARPKGLPSKLFGALSLAMQGKPSAAREAYADLVEAFPGFDPRCYADDEILDPTARDMFFQGLARLAVTPDDHPPVPGARRWRRPRPR